MDASQLLGDSKIVPVVVLASAAAAVPLAETLLAASLNVIEVTLRTDEALQGIVNIATSVPEMIVGAGSVRRPEQMTQVAEAGAKFAVSPGSSAQLLDAARSENLPFIPGAATASEMIALMERGYLLQKFFPAELAGGQAFLKAVGGPLPELRFMPTGGVTPDNAIAYLDLKNVACVGGSWITPVDLQRSRQFAAIRDLAASAAKMLV